MEKSKLNISVSVLAAALYFLGLVGGYTPVLLLAGFILIAESNVKLRRHAVKTICLMIVFSLASYVLGLLPAIVSLIRDFAGAFGGYVSIPFVASFIAGIKGLLSIAEIALFMLLGVSALTDKNIKLPVIDDFVNKHVL